MLQKRFLCSRAPSTLLKTTIKDTQKWRIKQVKKSNFNEVVEEIKTHIYNSDFISISLQKTGSYSSPWQKILPLDTPDIAYLKAKRSAERFQLFQFAVCPFSLSDSKVTAFPHNFHLFPRDELKRGVPSYTFSCQTSYLTSMARLGFDFNSCIYDGISYLSRAQESSLKPLAGNPVRRAHDVQSASALSVADSLFIERIKSRVNSWRTTCKDSGLDENPLVAALRKVVMREHGSRPCLDVDVCSERQVQLVIQVLKDFTDVVPLLIPTKRGDTQGVRIVLTSSEDDKNLFEKELSDLEEEQSKQFRGFREVIDLISASQKPVIAHNSLDDFTFIYSKFLSPLPPSIDEFKSSLISYFPCVIDMGHLMKDFSPNKNMNNLSAASSFLRSHFFAPVDIDIPLEGAPDEMHEGKIHGHNVLKISHVFAKFYSIIKHNKQSVGKSLELSDFANIFVPSSVPLENSDDDVSVSSGSMRKLSCGAMVFLWGFRIGLSAGEIKRILSGSLEAFSTDFDVQLVDKSCAVIAFQLPELATAFVDAMSSGGTAYEGLTELISQGFRAANYETYRYACNLGKWDPHLADSLDQVATSANQSPADGLGRSPYEIWWDDNTVLNLDDV